MKIIVDTNILIDFSRKTKYKKEKIIWPELVDFAKREGHQLIFPTIALFEFFAGNEMEDSLNINRADNLLSDTVILDLTEEVSRLAAGLFRKYQLEIGVVDYLLAATSIVLEGELATLNVKHFKMIKNLKLFDLKKLD